MSHSTAPVVVGQRSDDLGAIVADLQERQAAENSYLRSAPKRRVRLDCIRRGGGTMLYAVGSVAGKSFNAGMRAADFQSFAKFQARLAERTTLWAWHPAEDGDAGARVIWRDEVARAFERGRIAQ